MQIVIDIPEAVLNRVCFTETYPLDMVIVCNAIHEHIKLPKGHGRLIDADAFIKAECSQCDGNCGVCECDCLNCKSEWRCDFIKDIDSADVIIEADKEG